MISSTQRKSSCPCTRTTLFAVNKDEWDTKEDISKSMKNIFYAPSGYTIWPWAEVMLNSKKIKPVALAIIQLHIPGL